MKKLDARRVLAIDFDLRQLEIFKQVVELESFSRAAQAVFLAQASVSERIANLENAVGTKLLDRLGRRVAPTRAGELLYAHACRLLEMKNRACLELQDFLGLKQGEVRLGGSTIPGEYILPKVLGGFRATHPQVTVSITVGSTDDIVRKVLAGDFELGIIGSRETDPNVECRELWRDELVLAVPKGHRWAARKHVTMEELQGEPFILRNMGSGTLRILKESLSAKGHGGPEILKPVAVFGTSTAVKEGIKSGLGVSILSSRALETELAAGLLKPLRIRGLTMHRFFYLIMDKRRGLSPLCSAMHAYLMSQAERDGPGDGM